MTGERRPLVLIVDDSAHVTEPLQILFEETGRRVTVAGSARGLARTPPGGRTCRRSVITSSP